MRKQITSIFFALLLLFLGTLSISGCGAAPPASIPAPVGSLMTVSAPDATGTSTVSGADGAALPGATVAGANASQGGSVKKWQNPFLGNAYAQPAGGIEDQTVADGNGAFTLRLKADFGDELQFRQFLNGEQSDVTILTVP